MVRANLRHDAVMPPLPRQRPRAKAHPCYARATQGDVAAPIGQRRSIARNKRANHVLFTAKYLQIDAHDLIEIRGGGIERFKCISVCYRHETLLLHALSVLV